MLPFVGKLLSRTLLSCSLFFNFTQSVLRTVRTERVNKKRKVVNLRSLCDFKMLDEAASLCRLVARTLCLTVECTWATMMRQEG